jgi:hypothetical protein
MLCVALFAILMPISAVKLCSVDLMLCSLIDTNVSEEPPASIFRVEISILFVCKNAACTSRFIWTYCWLITHNVKLSSASSNNFIPGFVCLNYVLEVRCFNVCGTSSLLSFSRCVSYCCGLWTVHPPLTFGLPSQSVPVITSREHRWTAVQYILSHAETKSSLIFSRYSSLILRN